MGKRILSVFIDESGDFGEFEQHAPYYIVSMILHDQEEAIDRNIEVLEEHLRNLGRPPHAIHVGPLIRRESVYREDLMEDRKRLFCALFNFARKLPFTYVTAKVRKSECRDVLDLPVKLTKAISQMLKDHLTYFAAYEKIIVYYDNGQVELTKILTGLFHGMFGDVEFRKVSPVDYKLFQVADLVCTLELLAEKAEGGLFTRSEQEFFHSPRDFKKNFYKCISQKHI